MPNNPEQIQVLFEIAMSIGSSLDLKQMVKKSLLSYLRKLNCSSGAVLILKKNEEDIYYFKTVLSIPYKTKFSQEFTSIVDTIPNKKSIKAINQFIVQLPLSKTFEDGSIGYIMNLPGFGLVCLKKTGDRIPDNILFFK